MGLSATTNDINQVYNIQYAVEAGLKNLRKYLTSNLSGNIFGSLATLVGLTNTLKGLTSKLNGKLSPELSKDLSKLTGIVNELSKIGPEAIVGKKNRVFFLIAALGLLGQAYKSISSQLGWPQPNQKYPSI